MGIRILTVTLCLAVKLLHLRSRWQRTYEWYIILATFVSKVDGSSETIQNGDLFWALRGGGSAFGVITEFKLILHPAPDQFVQLNLYMGIVHPILGETYKYFLEFYTKFLVYNMTNNWGGYMLPNNGPGEFERTF